MSKNLLVAICTAFAFCPAPIFASITVTFEQIGLDTVINYSGSFDTAGGISTDPLGPISTYLINEGNRILLFDGTLSKWDFTRTSQPTGLFTGNTGLITIDSFTGDSFGIINDDLPDTLSFFAPTGYSGETISGTATISNFDVSSLGVTEQTIFFGAAPNQDITFTVIPEPSSLMMLAFAGLATIRRRSR